MRLTEEQVRETQQRLFFAESVTFPAEFARDLCADWLEQHEMIKAKDAEIAALKERVDELEEHETAGNFSPGGDPGLTWYAILGAVNNCLNEGCGEYPVVSAMVDKIKALEAENAALKAPAPLHNWNGQGGTERVEVELLDVAALQKENAKLRKVERVAREYADTARNPFQKVFFGRLIKALAALDALKEANDG
jgi:cell division protein FtsB